MLARLITPQGDALPVLRLPELPRAGDTVGDPEGACWRVTRVHWPLTPEGRCDGVELHVARANVDH